MLHVTTYQSQTCCKNFTETYVHLFWECPKSAYVWKYVHSLTLEKFRTKNLSLFPLKVPNHLVFLYTLCKYFLHICRCFKIEPNVRFFKRKLAFHLEALKCQMIMQNKEEKFHKIWRDTLLKL